MFTYMIVCILIGGFTTVEVSSEYDYINRLNYGVWFTPVRTVRIVTDVWMQVFDVPLPDVPGDCHQALGSRVTCGELRVCVYG